MRKRLPFLSLLLLLASLAKAQPCREVIAYYPSWKWYSRQQLVNPTSIDYSKYTIINYAFFKPLQDGRVIPFDPYADKTLLLGEISAEAPAGYARRKDLGNPRWHRAGTSLVSQAHSRGVKIMISIGGWTMSDQFPGIAASAEKRRQFAASCSEMIRTYQIDGIDIDWEYPGYVAQNGTPADKQNFTLLMREIRDSLDALEPKQGRDLLLSAAFGVAPVRLAGIEWEQVTPLLDYINLMTYDFYGGAFSMTNHHSPLFAPEKGLNGFDLNSTVRNLTENYGVPAEKVNIGLAFYGRSLKTKGAAGLHVTSRQVPDQTTFPEDKGTPMYYNIVPRLSQFSYRWDSAAQAPYLEGKNFNTFVSFEDERSVEQKARYILWKRLAGAIVWDLTGDYLEDPVQKGKVARTPLADMLATTLCGEAPLTPEAKVEVPAALPMRPLQIQRKMFAPRITDGLDILQKKEPRKKRGKRRASS